MTTVQLKNEIQNVLDKVPEDVLQDILYLSSFTTLLMALGAILSLLRERSDRSKERIAPKK